LRAHLAQAAKEFRALEPDGTKEDFVAFARQEFEFAERSALQDPVNNPADRRGSFLYNLRR
jgi:hypothetical protein